MASASYFFVFGRTPHLAFKELQTLFPSAVRIIDEVAQVEFSENIDVKHLLDILGGTTKIAKNIGKAPTLDGTLASFLTPTPNSFTFGVSGYGFASLPKTLLSEMKKALEFEGHSARYISSKGGDPLTSVVIDKEHAHEIIVIRNSEHEFLVGKTTAVQPYDVWSERDYGRPHADAKSGMLPLKVARMIVNIALSSDVESRNARQKTLLDPFCGMGTVLAEAYMMGCRVIGCDTSEQAVAYAKENLAWLSKTHLSDKGSVAKVFVGDAVHVSDVLPPESVHAVVTEPYMGSTAIANNQSIDPSHIKNIIKGLEKLYIGCLRNWHTLLAPEGKVVIALPAYAVSGRIYFVKKVVDMCENLGYTIVDGPIEYSRPQAVVKRQFYILEKI